MNTIGPKTQAKLDQIRTLIAVINENQAAFLQTEEGQKPMFRPSLGQAYLNHLANRAARAEVDLIVAIKDKETTNEEMSRLEAASQAAKEAYRHCRQPIEEFYVARRELGYLLLAETGIIDQPLSP